MDTNVNYTIVGAFVISLVTCIVLGVIWLSSGLSSGSYQTYEIDMKESVAGLNVDSVVEFNGVTVGSVKSILIDTKDPRLVVLLVSINDKTPITQGTRATLNSKGLTGITYIALVDDGTDLRPLTKEKGQDYAVINTSPSFFWRLDTGMKKLNENISRVTKSLEALLDEENLRSIKEILIDVRHVSRTLATNTEQLTTIIQNTAKASAQFTPLLQHSQQLMGTLSTQIIPEASEVMLHLNQITTNLSAASREIKDNPAVVIRGRTQQPLGPGE